MKVFDRELDDLEEIIVNLALVFFISTLLAVTLGRTIWPITVLAGLGASLSFFAGTVAVLLWTLRRIGSPIYDRLRRPEKSRLISLLPRKDQIDEDH
jgi:protein-S-isoprenylcysteine O-methyltransferase Ste14